MHRDNKVKEFRAFQKRVVKLRTATRLIPDKRFKLPKHRKPLNDEPY